MNNLIRTSNIDTIVHLLDKENDKASRVLSIWGPSGSGKTYLAHEISTRLADSRVLSIDNYLSEEVIAGPRYPAEQFIDQIEGVNPNIWDQNRLNHDLKLSLTGAAFSVPQFDTKNRIRLPQEVIMNESSTTIVEGAYAYENDIKADIAALVVVDSNLHSRFMRKIARTTNRTGRTDVDESIQRYLRQTQGSLAFTWNRHSSQADVIFENNPPLSESPMPQTEDCAERVVFSKNAINLTPMNGYGELEEGEILAVDPDKRGNLRMVHLIGDRAILNCAISISSLNDIRKYYVET